MKANPTQKVLLAHSYFLYFDAKQVRKMRPYSPLATLIAAAVLRNQGYEVSLFDAMLAPDPQVFHEMLARERPSVVALLEDNFNFLTKMCTTRMREAAFAMIADARQCGARVVVNGSDATDQPQLYFDAGAEAIIIGETEHSLPELLTAWQRGESPEKIPGLLLPLEEQANASSWLKTPPRNLVEDLDKLPFPAWDLVDPKPYRQAWKQAHGRFSWNLVTTRGCPFQCNWCAKPLYGRRYAQKSPARVAEEMAKLQECLAPEHIWFADDIFGLTPNWIESLAQELEIRQVKIPFTMQSRVDLMTKSACRALAHAGAEEVWLGVESGAQKILDAMDKETTLDGIRFATQELRAHGVRPSWFLQLGYPGEDWPEILATRDLVREQVPHDVGVSVSYPLPGTLFYERVHSQMKEKTNWTDSDDLAMLFTGTFQTEFYRMVRDLLHEEAVIAIREDAGSRESGQRLLDVKWQELGQRQSQYRSAQPTRFHSEDAVS
ncbi:MAG: radical SAM protein [Planctomycetota bacterium]|nr:MAG: radical SAM protein [Planctomycetota bacterium]